MHPLAVCGPSGAGKSTLISMLRKEFPDDFGFSVSHTTRGPRPGERDGVDYHFSEKAAMEAGIADGKFLESANVHGNLYGTSFEAISSVAEHHRVCVLDIDVQGVESCRRAGFDAAAFIFIAPPSLGSLEARLRKRGACMEPRPSPSPITHMHHPSTTGTETEERIRKRLDGAVHELAASERMAWDARIVNDDLDEAYARLRVAVEGARTACRSTRDEALD